mmetsp:Transcript_23126/g.64587  ORF Transcript_23126/g.64587 Transcript_23126/m.64587 type:complete len:235 (+) Transcript_23126:25-729(+)
MANTTGSTPRSPRRPCSDRVVGVGAGDEFKGEPTVAARLLYQPDALRDPVDEQRGRLLVEPDGYNDVPRCVFLLPQANILLEDVEHVRPRHVVREGAVVRDLQEPALAELEQARLARGGGPAAEVLEHLAQQVLEVRPRAPPEVLGREFAAVRREALQGQRLQGHVGRAPEPCSKGHGFAVAELRHLVPAIPQERPDLAHPIRGERDLVAVIAGQLIGVARVGQVRGSGGPAEL